MRINEKELSVAIKHYFIKVKWPWKIKKKLDKIYGKSRPSIRTVYKSFPKVTLNLLMPYRGHYSRNHKIHDRVVSDIKLKVCATASAAGILT